jgi:hypothetical protein
MRVAQQCLTMTLATTIGLIARPTACLVSASWLLEGLAPSVDIWGRALPVFHGR